MMLNCSQTIFLYAIKLVNLMVVYEVLKNDLSVVIRWPVILAYYKLDISCYKYPKQFETLSKDKTNSSIDRALY